MGITHEEGSVESVILTGLILILTWLFSYTLESAPNQTLIKATKRVTDCRIFPFLDLIDEAKSPTRRLCVTSKLASRIQLPGA